jgi:2-aminoadipate transaminase
VTNAALDDFSKFAVEEKVAFVPSSVFDFTGDDRFAVRANFTRSSPEAIREGVRRLERAVVNCVSSRERLRDRRDRSLLIR